MAVVDYWRVVFYGNFGFMVRNVFGGDSGDNVNTADRMLEKCV